MGRSFITQSRSDLSPPWQKDSGAPLNLTSATKDDFNIRGGDLVAKGNNHLYFGNPIDYAYAKIQFLHQLLQFKVLCHH